MAKVLGEPAFDPHGAPIPTRHGTVDEMAHATLAEVETGSQARVTRVLEDDRGVLLHLGELGIRPGVHVVLTSRVPFGGPSPSRSRESRGWSARPSPRESWWTS